MYLRVTVNHNFLVSSKMQFNPYDSDTYPDPQDDQPFGFDENGDPIWDDPQSSFIDNEPSAPYGTPLQPNPIIGHNSSGQPIYATQGPPLPLPQINQGSHPPPPRPQSSPGNFNDRYDEEPHIHTASDVDCVIMTDLDKLSEVLATRTFFHGGRLSDHVSRHRGCIILPLSAITQIRKPSGHHVANPKCLIYHELDPNQDYHDVCPNFAQAADFFNS